MSERRNPYHIIKHRYVTEKSSMLGNLKTADSNPSLKKCESPKYVFIVDRSANKREIAKALEEIHSEDKIQVVKVNTISIPEKKRRVRGRAGYKSAFKKAVVTLRPGDSLDNV